MTGSEDSQAQFFHITSSTPLLRIAPKSGGNVGLAVTSCLSAQITYIVFNFISGLMETGINISAAPSATKMVSGSDR
jgi:hypothetical protein